MKSRLWTFVLCRRGRFAPWGRRAAGSGWIVAALLAAAAAPSGAAAQEFPRLARQPTAEAEPAPAGEGPVRLPETVIGGGAVPAAEDPSAAPAVPPPFDFGGDAALPPPGGGATRLSDSLIGRSMSATSGFANQQDIQSRPFARSSDLVELVPNLFANEHAGGGKASEFFIRGVSNFHGTDFSTFVDGVPINLPSHAHGQGYTDINFVIPELVQSVDFRKGPYYVDVGDFSSTGTVAYQTARHLDQGIFKFEKGQYDYYRVVAADSAKIGQGEFLYGMEGRFFDGPWTTAEDLRKATGMLKYTIGDEDTGLSLTAQAMNNSWVNANQIPERVVAGGATRFTNLSPTDGGVSNRYGLNLQFWHEGPDDSRTTFDAFSYWSDLTLYANYTFFLENPVDGDQFRQIDRRTVSGLRAEHQWKGEAFGKEADRQIGFWFRADRMPLVALDHTADRFFVETVRTDEIQETDLAVYYSSQIHWTDDFRTVHGIRGDFFNFNVQSRDEPFNSGNVWEGTPQPKFSAIWTQNPDTEWYFNWGMGFHSNDARGVLTRVQENEATGALEPTAGIPGLIQTEGYEIGVRNSTLPGVNTTAAVYYLKLDSELLFEGDDGAIVPSQATERVGVEWNSWIQAADWLTIDKQLSWTRSRYVQDVESEVVPGAVGRYVPNAPIFLATAGATAQLTEEWFATLRYRHFGSRALIEDGSVTSDPTNVFNLRVGYQGRKFAGGVDLLNLFNSPSPEISYYYITRLQGEPVGGIADRINHPTLPFQWRMYLTYMY